MIFPIKLVLGFGLAAVTLAAPAAVDPFDSIISLISLSRNVLKQTAAFINNFPQDGNASPHQLSDILDSIGTAIVDEDSHSLFFFTQKYGVFNAEQLNSITQEVDVLIPGIEKVLSSLQPKKAAFEAFSSKKDVNAKFSSLLKVFEESTGEYLTAVIDGTAPESQKHFVDLKNQITTEFESTRSLFVV